MDYIRLGQHLKSSRETKGYTQKYIADVLKVTPQTISTWETGKNKIDAGQDHGADRMPWRCIKLFRYL